MLLDRNEQPGGSLDAYLGLIAGRLRAAAATRGLGALAGAALAVTCVCVFLANRFAFSPASVLTSRTLLVAALGTVVAFLLVRPLRRLARGSAILTAADEAERRAPQFGGRLRTWADETARAAARGRAPSSLLALLAEDTRQAAAGVPLDTVVSRLRIAAFAAAGCAGLLLLVWLGTSGPGYWQYGTAKLWAGWFLPQTEPLYELRVEPGDATIRQGGQLRVTATPFGFEPGSAWIYAKFESSVDWERAPMGPQLQGVGYAFTFSLVNEPLRYYVEAGRIRSREFNVGVVAMPTVENIRLEYAYPEWSGLAPRVEDSGGDILAVRETRVTLILTTDRPLERGRLVTGLGEVAVRGNRAELEVLADSTYHVAALYRGERVRLTEEYFITAVPDEKPEVRILEPGRDWRASSIEEVGVQVEATDDFGLRRLELHYAVNGVAQAPVALPVRAGARKDSGEHLFYLEEMGASASAAPSPGAAESGALPPPVPEASLVPGDLISYYAVAADAKREVRSDMFFINVQPFERRFSQSQQAGGQGGGQQQDEISRRQKEILLATWNLIQERDAKDGREPSQLRESATMLAELQATLMRQAQTLVQRTRARQLTDGDPQFKRFAEFMEQAAEFMAPAAEALQGFDLDEAVPPEQQALQYLLRAEALFTDIQMSMGRNGQGGGASRDLAEMFELEMDLEKNQYETGSGASAQRMEQEIDEAMQKLEELARRQEKLARQTQDRERPSFEQRWQQEVLRREAEDLKRELERLDRRQQRQQRSGERSGQQAQGGSGAPQPFRRAIEQLDRATREMERGGQSGSAQGAAANAGRQLRQAAEALARQQRQESQEALAEMAEQADELVDQQERSAAELQKSLQVALAALKAEGSRPDGRYPTGMTREEEIDLANRKRALGERLAEIEREMQRHSRQLRGRDDAAAKALLDALLELQQSEAAPAIQRAAELVQGGLAPYAAGNEEAISRALRQLRSHLREAAQLAQEGGEDSGPSLDSMLAEVERLRRDLEAAAGSGDSEDPRQALGGQQPGQEQTGPGGNRPSEGQGQSGAPAGPRGAGSAWQGAWGRAGGTGDEGWRPKALAPGADRAEREQLERALASGATEVTRLVQGLGSHQEFDPRELDALRRFAQGLGDGRFRGNPQLLEREYRTLLALLEQLEVQLRRQVELDDKEEVRAIVSEPVPEAYREAVAEYFRRLGGAR